MDYCGLFDCSHATCWEEKTNKFRVDCKVLTGLNKVQGHSLERIRAELQEFMPYEIEYLQGEKMPADGLSRMFDRQVETITSETIQAEQLWNLQKEDHKIKKCCMFSQIWCHAKK